MEFELKNVLRVGDVQAEDEDNSRQLLNITAGVVGCPYEMVITKTVKYVFSNDLTINEAINGATPFAENWVSENYPNT